MNLTSDTVLYNVENDTTALPLRRIIATFRGWEASFEIHQSTIYYAGLLGRWDKRIVDQESDVPNIIFFILFIDLGHSKLFIFISVIL